MKKTILFISLLAFVAVVSCSKSSSTPTESNGSTFKFVSLTPSDSIMTVNGILTIMANATGTGLKFKWTADYGTFIGSGSSVQWTVCHSDNFHIQCEVTDANGNSDKKETIIHVR
ncbi:MAG: hypothetical protein NTU98_01155 [Bacteroidetes bacterium]|nr:hypothetical protein [Bacteroidota bacterium]